MAKYTLAITMLAALISCNNQKQENAQTVEDTTMIYLNPDTASVKKDSHYFWVSELVPKQGLVMKKESPVSEDSLTADIMINRLNDSYPEIKLQFVKVSGDSIFVKIDKSNYLTRQMGSTGAEAYLAEVTYNLTELKNIGFVDIRFKEGAHASPGTYSRTDFVHEKKQ